MDEPAPPKKERNKIELIAAIILVTVLIISVVYLVMLNIDIQQRQIESNDENKPTSLFTNVTSENAYDLINTTTNLTIVDCRGLEGCGQCQFKNQGHITGASLNDNPTTLFNSTNDILVYSKYGPVGANFCQELLNNVYGKVYNLDGGIEAWTAEYGYPLVYGT